jgi:hypothetical protein
VLGATRLTDSAAIRLIVASFAAFHLATAALELSYRVVIMRSPAGHNCCG